MQKLPMPPSRFSDHEVMAVELIPWGDSDEHARTGRPFGGAMIALWTRGRAAHMKHNNLKFA